MKITGVGLGIAILIIIVIIANNVSNDHKETDNLIINDIKGWGREVLILVVGISCLIVSIFIILLKNQKNMIQNPQNL